MKISRRYGGLIGVVVARHVVRDKYENGVVKPTLVAILGKELLNRGIKIGGTRLYLVFALRQLLLPLLRKYKWVM
jgi:hypothetical protein